MLCAVRVSAARCGCAPGSDSMTQYSMVAVDVVCFIWLLLSVLQLYGRDMG
jgi:hypothetical protein